MMNSSAPRVAVLMGGPSAEHDVSLSSGRKVLSALVGQDPLPVIIGRDGRWTVGDEPAPSVGVALDRIKARADVAFLALHGTFGEDGTIQGLLDAHGLAYTGSGVLASALAMDKPRTKMAYRHIGLSTPSFVFFGRAAYARRGPALLETAEATLGYPMVVKPARLGSSVGISFPKSRAELSTALDAIFASTEDVIIEQFVKGREMTCGVLEIAREERTFALPVTEIVPAERFEFFDYTAKYTPGASQEITPARIPPETARRIQDMALAAHEVLGCRDLSRSDFLLTADDQLFILETNTLPGMTETSLLPQGAQAVGIEYAELITILIEDAARRRRPG